MESCEFINGAPLLPPFLSLPLRFLSRTFLIPYPTNYPPPFSAASVINASFLAPISPIDIVSEQISTLPIPPNSPKSPSQTNPLTSNLFPTLSPLIVLTKCVRTAWLPGVRLRKIGETQPLQIRNISSPEKRSSMTRREPSIYNQAVRKMMIRMHPTARKFRDSRSFSTQVFSLHTPNISSDFISIFFSSTPYSVMILRDREYYKYIILLMNVRQQPSHNSFHHYSTIMAFPVRSALDVILRNESNSVRFRASSTPSLSNALQLTLAGKLLSAKKPSISNMILFASRTWECPNRLMCYDHGNGIYSFEFINPLDVERVMDGGPWYLNGDLLLVDRMDPKLPIEQLPFSETKLWVRCFDLPPMCFNIEFATLIGNGIGKFCETDLPPEDSSLAVISIRRVPSVRKYLRVKVTHNLYSPIKRSQLVEIENPRTHEIEELTSRLAYERLPATCYRCGFLGHSLDACSFSGPSLFGDWIRVEKFYRSPMPEKIPNPLESNTSSAKQISPKGNGTVSKVSVVADLVSRPDPSIIQVNFKDVRDSGKLPPINSKGKQPMIEYLTQGNTDSGLLPLAESSNREGPVAPSLLGAAPVKALMPPRSPQIIRDDTIVLDSEDGTLASYFNPSIPHGDLFSPTTNRCLFRSDFVHPAFSTNRKNLETSPNLPTPINKDLTLLDNPVSFTEMLTGPPQESANIIGINNEDSKRNAVHTRRRAAEAAKPADTPRVKRGRAPPPPDS